MIGKSESSGNRTLIGGFDGMDWRYLERFAGDLSEILSLREDGTTISGTQEVEYDQDQDEIRDRSSDPGYL